MKKYKIMNEPILIEFTIDFYGLGHPQEYLLISHTDNEEYNNGCIDMFSQNIHYSNFDLAFIIEKKSFDNVLAPLFKEIKEKFLEGENYGI